MKNPRNLIRNRAKSILWITLVLGLALSISSCDSVFGSGGSGGSGGSDEPDTVSLGDGSVVVEELAPSTLSVGENAIFRLTIDLPEVPSPEGYRVWVYPKSGTYDGFCYAGSDVLDAKESSFARYAYPVAADGSCTDREAGTVESWTVSVNHWDGEENTAYAVYSFDHTVTWE